MFLLYISLLQTLLAGHSGILAEICTSTICRYEFVVSYEQTMVYQHPTMGTYDVQLNASGNGFVLVENGGFRKKSDPLIGTSVGLRDVIAADGYQRNIITINGQFPAPDIEVQVDAQVVVHVINKLGSDDITIHWHGLRMRGTPWMDGVPDVSHCPIPAGHAFTYRFIADPAGTHWYHSHVARQHLDGLHGMIIVHPRTPIRLVSPYYLISVRDWFSVDSHTHEMLDPYSMENAGTGGSIYATDDTRDYLSDGSSASGLLWHSGLINGRGRFDPNLRIPLASFRVIHGETYKFRMANVGSDFPLRVSVDNHKLNVVATDGYEIEPIMAQYIDIYNGESIDFELAANQAATRYWLRASTQDITSNGYGHEVKAVVIYEPFSEGPDPKSKPEPCTELSPCRIYNCPFGNYHSSYNRTCININQVRTLVSPAALAETYRVNKEVENEIFLNIGFQGGASMNGIRFVNPSAPPFQRDSVMVDCTKVCKESMLSCRCTHKYQLQFMETVQLVVSNFKNGNGADLSHHPFHMHGHHFAVIHTGYPPINQTTGLPTGPNADVICNDDGRLCRRPQWNPPRTHHRPFNVSAVALKNTVVVPSQGYVVLRFRADNPGFWLAHCHMATHQAGGMAVLFEEGLPHLSGPPTGFPTCRNYEPSDEDFTQYLLSSGGARRPSDKATYMVQEKSKDDFRIQQLLKLLKHPTMEKTLTTYADGSDN